MRFRSTSRLLAASLTVSFAAFAAISPAAANGRRLQADATARTTTTAATTRTTGTTPATTSAPDEQRATEALSDAQALFTPPSGSARERRRMTAATGPRDATLVLRDLRARVDDLPTASDRAAAERILARPTDHDPNGAASEPKYAASSPVGTDCGPHVCVHWVERSTDRQRVGDDGDIGTIPAQVTRTLATLDHVYTVEVGTMGYRPPVSDADSASTGVSEPTSADAPKTDVYLADTGADGLYGYCTTDDPDAIDYNAGDRRVSSYCVLDNDFRHGQFPAHTPLQNLQVTAAHEFFHAIQNAYDWREDPWLVEGTAAWMEDEVYDSVNDNRQYLAESPLTAPYVPLDYTDYSADPELAYQPYGAWIFWRFLSERAGPGRSDDPTIVRQVWQAAVTRYSTSALTRVLARRGSSFADWFAAFGTWTSNPRTYFREGRFYPRPASDYTRTLTKAHRSTGWKVLPVSHMALSLVRITPGRRLGRHARVEVAVNMPARSRGSVAQVVIHRRSGALTVRRMHLDAHGDARATYGFNPASVGFVRLDLANASTSFRCNAGPEDVYQSCHGVAKYDYRPERFRVRLR